MAEPLHDEPIESRRRLWLGAIAIMLATLAAYLPAIQGGYIWDDDSYVTENRLLHDVDGLLRIWVPRETPQYYPIVFTAFWVEYQLWGLNPMGYHLVNVLLHGMNAVLLWLVLAKLRVPGAWMIGAVFALHPIHVESVAWITERKNVLSLFFYLLAAMAYLKIDPVCRSTRPQVRWGWYSALLALFVLALLSKSVTCSLPAALILIMLWKRAPITSTRLAMLAPMFIIGFALAMNTAMLERDHVGAIGEDFEHGIGTRTLIASRALLFYPLKIVWPEPVMFIYPRWDINPANPLDYVPLLICLAIGVALLWLFAHGRRAPFTAAAFYAGTVFPAIGFFNVFPHLYSFVADHFVYHASIGVIALLIGGTAHVFKPNAVLRAASALVLVVLFALTWLHATTFYNAETVYRDTINKNPDAWMAHNNLASILLKQAEAAAGSGDIDRAAQLAAEAEVHALESLARRPQNSPSYSNLSEARRLLGWFDEALDAIDAAIDILPSFPEYHWKRGRLLHLLGRAEEAIDAFRHAANLAPMQHFLRATLAQQLLANGRLDEAAAEFEAMLDIQPNDFQSLLSLAEIRNQQGQFHEARRLYLAALQNAPGFDEEAQIVVRLIRFLSTCPDETIRDHDMAIGLAQQLVEATERRDPSAIGIAAWAFGEAGQYDEAITLTQFAITLAERSGHASLITMLRTQLAEQQAAKAAAQPE